MIKKTERPSPKASKGYLFKLARVVNSKHHRDFDDTKFCEKHGIVKKS